MSSSETHPATTNAASRQTTRQGQELTHVRRFLAAARVCVRGGRRAGGGRGKAAVAVIVAVLLAGGLVAPAGGSSVRGAFANLQLVSSVPGELTISWDLPDPSPSDYRIMWAEEGLEFLSYRFANEALRGNEYPDGEATSVTLTGLTEGATYKVKARSRYSSGGRNNSQWNGPWSNEVTASVSAAAPVRGAFANLQLVSSVPGELTISWDLPDPSPSDYRIMWAEEGLEFLSYRFANEALRGNEYPDGEATSVTLTGLTEGATYKVKARSRYSSGGRNNSRWSGPWSDEVTASVSAAAPVAQEPGDDQQQVDDPQIPGQRRPAASRRSADPGQRRPAASSTIRRPRATTTSSSLTTRLGYRTSLLRPARRCLRMV